MLYRVKMDDGTEENFDATCAADAIQAALLEYRGHRVNLCWRGDDKARINFDVPKHDPLPPKEKVPKRRPEELPSMFDDAQIKRDSEEAYKRTAPQADIE